MEFPILRHLDLATGREDPKANPLMNCERYPQGK